MTYQPTLSKAAIKQIEPLLAFLKANHVDKPVFSPELERLFRLPGPQIRKIVALLRSRLEPIGSGVDGYFYTRQPENLDGTLNHLIGRRNAIEADIDHIRAIQDRLRAGELQAGLLL